jgi:LmbE family N-acetylglucosaminyl deacetylase
MERRPAPPAAPRRYDGADAGLRCPAAEVFVPDGVGPREALERTTHLAIVAHPDDLEIVAYPAIEACFDRADRWFTGVVVTDGAGGPALAAAGAAEDLVRRRAAEQRAAACVGRYGAVVQLGVASAAAKGDGATEAVVADLRRVLDLTAPRELFLHNPADRHDTHVAVLLRSFEALRRGSPDSLPQVVLGLEAWRDLDWLVEGDRVELPVGERPHLGAALVALFDSQIAGQKRYDLAVVGRRAAHATLANPRQVDGPGGLCLALDLRPALLPGGPTLTQLVLGAVDRLRDDVATRLERWGGAGAER